MRFWLIGIGFASCATQRFYVSDERTGGEPMESKMQHFFVWGVGQTQSLDAKRVCGNKKVSHVESKWSFLNMVLNSLTYGFYHPRQAIVYCVDE